MRPGRFPGIAGNAGTHENDGKFHKSYQILNQTEKTLINYVWEKSHVIKQQEQNIPWISDLRMSSMVKNENPETPEINRKLSKSKSTRC